MRGRAAASVISRFLGIEVGVGIPLVEREPELAVPSSVLLSERWVDGPVGAAVEDVVGSARGTPSAIYVEVAAPAPL